MHHAIMQHAHRVCAAGPATPCSGVNKTYRKLHSAKLRNRYRMAVWRPPHAGMAVAKRPEGHCRRAKRAVLHCNTARLRPRKACFMAQKRPSGRPFRPVSACFPPKREQNAPPSERNRLWVNHLRKVLRGWRIYGRRRPTAAGAALKGAVVNIVRRILTVRSRAGRGAASRERTTTSAPGPAMQAGAACRQRPRLTLRLKGRAGKPSLLTRLGCAVSSHPKRISVRRASPSVLIYTLLPRRLALTLE